MAICKGSSDRAFCAPALGFTHFRATYSTESNYTCHRKFVVRKLDFNVLNIFGLIYKCLEVQKSCLPTLFLLLLYHYFDLLTSNLFPLLVPQCCLNR